MMIIILIQIAPVLFIGVNVFDGQTYPVSMLGILVSWLLPLFLIIIVAEIITEDYKIGMLSIILIHPVSRLKLLASKVLYLLLLTASILLFSMISAYIIGTICFGWGEEFVLRGISYSAAKGFFITLGSYLISIIPLLAFSIFIMLFALLLHNSALVVGISAGMLFLFFMLGEVVSELQPYLLTSYFSFFSHFYFYFNGNINSLLSALGIVSLYGIIPYIISNIVFYRRDLSV